MPIPNAGKRFIRGMLDDYAFTVLACLDAYEVTGAISYFNFAQRIADEMIARFADPNPAASSIPRPRWKKSFSSVCSLRAASHFRMRPRPPEIPAPPSRSCGFMPIPMTRSIAKPRSSRWQSLPELRSSSASTPERTESPRLALAAAHAGGRGGRRCNAAALLQAAIAPFAVNKSVVHLTDSEAVAQNLPPVLAETIPSLPALKEKKSVAIVCTNFACQPPVESPEELSKMLREAITGNRLEAHRITIVLCQGTT
jgi:uncharacterized protein